jgi:2-haloacid dehalogenase
MATPGINKFDKVEALVFDVFGTVVDWRGSIIRQGNRFSEETGIAIDWPTLADRWRAGYRPTMDRIASGAMPWTRFHEFNRTLLVDLVRELGIRGVKARQLDELNDFWRTLDPWPDVVRGLKRLKRRFVIGTLSNGDVRTMVDIARHAGLPWDVVFSSENFRKFKPEAEVYLGAAALLGVKPDRVALVAAHKNDLRAARANGLRTAFVERPKEHGPTKRADAGPERYIDVMAKDFNELADHFGL